MRIYFLHGLESPPISDKTEFLHSHYIAECPPIDYTDPNIFEKTLEEIKRFKPDLICGSSMGGWLAFVLSTHTGLPCLLFNPALYDRPHRKTTNFPIGENKFMTMLVLGKDDDIIIPKKTLREISLTFSKNIKSLGVTFEEMGHRTPIEIFKKNVELFTKYFVK